MENHEPVNEHRQNNERQTNENKLNATFSLVRGEQHTDVVDYDGGGDDYDTTKVPVGKRDKQLNLLSMLEMAALGAIKFEILLNLLQIIGKRPLKSAWEKCNSTMMVTSSHFLILSVVLTGTIFELNSHIKETNVLTKFHENWAKNVTSGVFTCFHYIHIKKNAPPTGGLVFSPIWTLFELVRDINKTNVLTNYHDDWSKIVTSRIHVIQLTGTIFELNSHIKETKVLPKFHENWAKNVTSKREKCPAHWRHCFSPIWTIFELVRDINKTNVLTNFHDDWAKNCDF
ncbi:hypothetical protein DPMN_069826 [Dreissena polymorpha]|uniref:Uncharacterized protein n=1 Tax=Dreissena polymorpha TaxID=45954 RepID=A0A9D3Z274_DREPO|nr:hypothetical protein DPMN_069826 [Dreissena polymorpha]